MVLLLTGALVVVLGLFCGAVLTLAPLGLLALTPTLALWALFPLLCIVGFVFFAMAGKMAQVRAFTYGVSCLLLLLALTAVAGVALCAASVIQAAGSLLPLWYVLAVAGTLGALGVAASQPGAVQS